MFRIIRPMPLFALSMTFLIGTAQVWACLRPAADKRAIQWSDAIVHAKLVAVAKVPNANSEIDDMQVTDILDGQPAKAIRVLHAEPPNAPNSCSGHLGGDEVGKNFLVLLRHRSIGDGIGYLAVYIAPADTDASSTAALADLIASTRKDEQALTPDIITAQAQALANAQDDTEAQQAEDTLEQMGIKAVPTIQKVCDSVSDIGKQRLQKVINDLTPPFEPKATTQPTTAP